eukprot:CFRG4374T1
MASNSQDAKEHPLWYKLYKLFRAGESLTIADMLAGAVIAFALYSHSVINPLLMWNAACQLVIFTVVVEIPALVTGHMCYVDIGWPIGLVVLGVNCLIYGEGWWLRKLLICVCMILHGGRMLTGGLVMFYPYVFKKDLSRYEYAKARWIEHDGLPKSWWVFKMLQETISQSVANMVVLAPALLIASANTTPHLHVVEMFGVAWWAFSWVIESIADASKLHFGRSCQAMAKNGTAEQKEALKTAVLGYAPWDGPEYRLWTLSRHPNYLGELSCWLSFSIMGLPSLLDSSWMPESDQWTVYPLMFGLLMVVRFFYDCLVYWTGAEPAEAGSVTRRPLFKEYQKTVPVMFPKFLHPFLPFVNHRMTPGWPLINREKSE